MSGEKRQPLGGKDEPAPPQPANQNAPPLPEETEDSLDRATAMWTGEEDEDERAALDEEIHRK